MINVTGGLAIVDRMGVLIDYQMIIRYNLVFLAIDSFFVNIYTL